ncbi:MULTISPECIES: glycoside hydrolase family 13 protein [Fructobacillus]|jgi:oligo-1,6-glucosidase|uniref:Glycosidase/amylase (Phosphorylase) (AmyA) n=1 Tax=Fructobacillus cardui TaxID=2893170 RepID=A0ABN9YUM2_9LACO|nr:alpha-glucosidase [Fructobacillus sp. EFB-N1]KMK53873.1 Oligo-1,6-glucosidase [Fructobacillus sp. EFB-N1]CAK1224450.1 Glycosidase/amylase (phosphorylase) (AmyA) [Fructobacillus cardui]CAK1247038.1 Glycosidase/amylase (phosphorylase) (AmyA) [Fructobacillus cardui]CAK1252018.1 Glycosidase/amylase (phosphorylase) (AmyA) [Fructobacillus cardui]
MTTSAIKWWQKAVVYQIYPRSFQDSNGDGIGDLKGIQERLSYVSKLGADVIWLNPIYQSPNKDNGYDISDYQAINPEFGTMQDFDDLLAAAHARDIKIVMDLVVNHSSDQHKWFIESRSNKDNDKRDFYIWRDPVDGHEPNNWSSFFSGSAWKFDEKSGQYYLHLFAEGQPDLNWKNDELRDQVYQMMNWWIDKGIDGFRMDVISMISKPDGLPDAPLPAGNTYANPVSLTTNGPHVHEYLREMRQKVLNNADLMTVGETSGVDIEHAQKYAGIDGSELNMVFQFEHMGLDDNPNPALGKWDNQPVSLLKLKDNLSKWQTELEGNSWNSLYWDNHDQPRIVSRFGNDSAEYREVSAKMLATLLHFMQGTPYIYQGEELGMTNAYNLGWDDFDDIEIINGRKFIVDKEKLVDNDTMLDYVHYKGRDNARTPMQWTAGKNAGFTDGTPWLKLNDNFETINATAALADDNSVFYHYQKLIKLRHDLDLITTGHYELIDPADDHVYTYKRIGDDQELLIINNFTDQNLERDYPVPADAQLLISNYQDDLGLKLRPYEAKAYLYNR